MRAKEKLKEVKDALFFMLPPGKVTPTRVEDMLACVETEVRKHAPWNGKAHCEESFDAGVHFGRVTALKTIKESQLPSDEREYERGYKAGVASCASQLADPQDLNIKLAKAHDAVEVVIELLRRHFPAEVVDADDVESKPPPPPQKKPQTPPREKLKGVFDSAIYKLRDKAAKEGDRSLAIICMYAINGYGEALQWAMASKKISENAAKREVSRVCHAQWGRGSQKKAMKYVEKYFHDNPGLKL